MIDREELHKAVEGLGSKLGVVEAGAREKVRQGAKGGFNL
jgi:hypothetical protein